LDCEAVSDCCRAIEGLEQGGANGAAVFAALTLTAENLDPAKASAAIRTGGIIV